MQKILAITVPNDNHLVSLFLVGKRKSQQLNCQYRQINKPTDVLAFPFYHFYKKELNLEGENFRDLGDIFICYPVAKNQAMKNKKTLEKETCFLFLHGLLHLLGHDHEKKNEKEKMFLLQKKILKQLNDFQKK